MICTAVVHTAGYLPVATAVGTAVSIQAVLIEPYSCTVQLILNVLEYSAGSEILLPAAAAGAVSTSQNQLDLDLLSIRE
jgi:hypothetical protein